MTTQRKLPDPVGADLPRSPCRSPNAGALLLLAGAATLLLAAPAEGQRSGGGGFAAVGTIEVNAEPLNERLRPAGFPEVASDAISFGGGGYGFRGRLLMGGEGHGFLASDETTTDGATGVRLGGGYGLFTLGWALMEGDRVRLYPKAGFGFGGYTLQIGRRDVPRFDDVLQDPGRGANLSHGGALLSLGLRAEIALGDRPRRGRPRGGPVLGVEVSTLEGVSDWGWSSEWGEVTRGPDAPFDGVHLRFTLGGGGRR